MTNINIGVPVLSQGMDSQRHISWPCLYSVSSVKIVRFVDISEIYDHHFLNFLFIIVYYK
jgi:hypothetical protein